MSLKITGKVISLLASEIYEKNFEALHKKEDQEFEKAKNQIQLTKEEAKLCKIVEQSTLAYDKLENLYINRKHWSDANKTATKDLLELKREQLKQPTSKYPTKNQLEKDITLAMLDAKSVEELVNKIKHKYKI